MAYLWYWPQGGWDFAKWKERQQWRPVKGEQSGGRELLSLVRPRDSLREWEDRRSAWLGLVSELLGRIEDRPPSRVTWETLENHERENLSVRRIRYALTDEESGYAWLLVPRGPKMPHPVAIALHQTAPQGKDEPIGLEGDSKLAYGMELAERGFAVIAPDAIGFGERRKDHPHALYRTADQFFSAHPAGSAMGKMVFDLQRLIDVLGTMEEVDSSRIGCIGHSHGGYGTFSAMVFEPRIRAGVISCGVSMLRSDPTPDRWWRKTALIPRLGLYEHAIEETPVDFHQWLALVAPRPLMVSAALADTIFPETDNLIWVVQQLKRVYRLYGARGRFHPWIFRGGHAFPRAARTQAYAMLAAALGPV